MTKLNDTQLVLLSNAAKRDDGAITRSPKTKGEAQEQAVAALLSRKLIKAVPKSGALPLWQGGPEGEPISLVITPKGLEAIGVEREEISHAPPAKAKAPLVKVSRKSEPPARPTKASPTPKTAKRANSKIAKVVEMMRKPGGATLKAIMGATDWQAHSVRGAISGAIKKKMGLKVTSETRGEERVYRIAS